MNRLTFSCFLVLAVIASVKSDSNILRLSKPVSKSLKSNFNVNASDDLTIERDDPPSRVKLVEWSKNNPELDWKNYLRMFPENPQEQPPRERDIDFTKGKLERTANSIKWLTDLYDPLEWSRAPGKLTKHCRKDIEWFRAALEDGKLWAAKSKSRNCCFNH